MRSPIGSRKQMGLIQLEEGLTAYRCPDSGGLYIPADCYMRWLSQQPARTPMLPPNDGEQQEIQEQNPAYLCPETETIMTRYKVGHGFRFSIDRSMTGGIWLNAGEWEALKTRNFHDEIHYIFTGPWQRDALRKEILASRRARLEDRIGSALLAEIDELKTKLEAHSNRDEIIAYIIN